MNKNKNRKQLKGVIVSDKMARTVVVSVTRLKMHKKYKKQYKVTTKYKAHDQNNEYRIGEIVIIQECRPMSRGKAWQVLKKA